MADQTFTRERLLKAADVAFLIADEEPAKHIPAMLRFAAGLLLENARLTATVAAYDAAACKFTAKVESGAARSVETYKELKACLERQDA